MKKIAALIMTFAMLASLTACGKEPAAKPTSIQIPESVPEENAPNEAADEKDNEEKPDNADGEENKSDENKENDAPSEENKVEKATPDAPKSEEAKITLPLKEYPAGSYFTKDGKECTVHDDCDWAVDECNCVNFDRSIWSMGFAKYVYCNVFGRHVTEETKLVKDIDLTAATAKAELSELPAGAYISVLMHDEVPHHMIMMNADDNCITVYQANYGGRCLVSTMTLTWERFAELFPHLDCIAK